MVGQDIENQKNRDQTPIVYIDSSIINLYDSKDIPNLLFFTKFFTEIMDTPKKDEKDRILVSYQVSFQYLRDSSAYKLNNTDQIEFQGIIFAEEILYLDALLQTYSVRFTNCLFNAKIMIPGGRDKSKSQLIFLKSTIKDIKFFSCLDRVAFVNSLIEKIDIAESTFASFSIDNSEIKNGKFTKLKIAANFSLLNGILSNAMFEDCNLNIVSQSNYRWDADISKLTNVCFINSIFIGRADFTKMELSNCNFSQVRFEDKADFTEANFFKATSFSYTKFTRVSFYGAKFKYSPIFNNIILKPDSHIYFGENNQGKKPIKRITFQNTIINGRLDFNHDNILQIDLRGSVIGGTLSRVAFDPVCANWETATLLKNEELKRNNFIKALEYKAIEKELYSQQLEGWLITKELTLTENRIKIIQDIVKKQSFEDGSLMFENLEKSLEFWNAEKETLESKKAKLSQKWGENLFSELPKNIDQKSALTIRLDSLSLWLNKIVNNYGQSWGQGILFTLLAWGVCFSLFYLPSFFSYSSPVQWWNNSWETLRSGKLIADMVLYLNPTDYKLLSDYIVKSHPRGGIKLLGGFWFILGKTLVPYGIYEIIVAFKKYNKI